MTEELKKKLNKAYGKGQEEWRAIHWRASKEEFRFRDEIRIIPHWLVALAATLFVGMWVLVFYLVITDRGPHPLPSWATIPVSTLAALPIPLLLLLFGYVNRDAKRRGMNATLWTLLAIFVPYLIGVIFYFIMRDPRPFPCPQCGEAVTARFNYCPSCKYNLRPTCPQCKREIHVGDKFCPYCGGELEEVAR